MATMNKDVAIAPKTDMATVAAKQLLELEAREDVYEDMTDFEIPMIKLMQGLSDLVKDGKAVIGDYCNSVDGTVLAKRNEPLELILLTQKKYWQVFKVTGDGRDDKEWIGTEEYSAETANYPYEEQTAEGIIRRVKTIDWYVLKANSNGDAIFGELPLVFRFQVSSLKAAKNLNSKLQQLKRQGKPRASKVFEFTSKKNPSDQHGNLIPVIELGRDTTKQELECAAMWTMDLAKATVKVNEGRSDAGETGDETEEEIL